MNSTRREMISILSMSNGLTVWFEAAAYMTPDPCPFRLCCWCKNIFFGFFIRFVMGYFFLDFFFFNSLVSCSSSLYDT